MKVPESYDCCGWATKNGIRCGDGRIICRDAFRVQDGHRVPLVWGHQHSTVNAILGHAILENRPEGVYAYCSFNNTPSGKDAKECVMHGDVSSLSILADNLNQVGNEVKSGSIREVSLVVAGANPGAYLESAITHGEPLDESEDSGFIYNDETILIHEKDLEDDDKTVKTDSKDNTKKEESEETDDDETVKEVLDSLTDKQKKAVSIVITQAIAEDAKEKKDEKEDDKMKHNAFEDGKVGNDNSVLNQPNVLTHAMFAELVNTAKEHRASLKDVMKEYCEQNNIIMHAAPTYKNIPTDGMITATGEKEYGFNDPSMLFPDYRSVSVTPQWISRNMDWVNEVMSSVRRTPFSRIKSLFADITEDEARAKGYITGKEKKSEIFATLKRTTDPQTIYKLQKMDRDDIIDITSFDVVAWIKAEMRVMLNEEIARAILIGDGRTPEMEDKIQEMYVRPVANDVPLFNTKVELEFNAENTPAEKAKKLIDEAVRSRKKYKGSGNPVFWTTEDWLTEMLLLEDGVGRKLYKSESELATQLRVRKIVTVEPMEGTKIKDAANSKDLPLIGIIVNLNDYTVGADKGGEINTFDQFDIDFNQQKYLIETRISGALTRPFSALTFLDKTAEG